MKVHELIVFLQQQPQDIEVLYRCYSEQDTLRAEDIELVKACPARPDGWVQNHRPDIEPVDYLLFPGN